MIDEKQQQQKKNKQTKNMQVEIFPSCGFLRTFPLALLFYRDSSAFFNAKARDSESISITLLQLHLYHICKVIKQISLNSTNIYLFKVSKRNTRKMSETCSKSLQ